MTDSNQEETVRTWTFGEVTLTLRLDQNNQIRGAAFGSPDRPNWVNKDELKKLSGFLSEFLYYDAKNSNKIPAGLSCHMEDPRGLTQLIDLD